MRLTVLASLVAVLQACTLVRAPSPAELAALEQPPAAVRAKVEALLPKAEAWLADVERQLAPAGRRLAARELAAARTLGVRDPASIRVLVLDEFPMPADEALLAEARRHGLGSPAEGGRSVGRLILLKPRVAGLPEVLQHELVHAAQQDRLGRRDFLRRYLTELEMLGYSRAPLELEAYERQRQVE